MTSERKLYREIEDDFGPDNCAQVIVELIAVHCDSHNFGTVYLLHSFASVDINNAEPLRLKTEALDSFTDALELRTAIGLFDSLVADVLAAREEPEDDPGR